MNGNESELKACCADFYQTDVVRLLMGDVLHPGGLALTEHLGEVLSLRQDEHVLDIACGPGSSAVRLAERFGCKVTGLDYSEDNLARARARVESKDMAQLIRFQPGDAEELPFEDSQFDAAISECSLCTFPDKATATREMARVLRAGGRAGITDVTVNGELPGDVQSALAWVACIAGAGPVSHYVNLLTAAGFGDFVTEDRSKDGKALIGDMRKRLTGLELAAKIGKVETGSIDFKGTRDALKRAEQLIDDGTIGYALIAATKR